MDRRFEVKNRLKYAYFPGCVAKVVLEKSRTQ